MSRLNNLRRHLDLDHTSNEAARVNGAFYKVKVTGEVSEALSLDRAVVALESTIISHGGDVVSSKFGNCKTGGSYNERENGFIPATVAILHGTPCVGLSVEELERLATLRKKAQKIARRNIAYVVSAFRIMFYSQVASGRNGATTVSATMFFCFKVGIPVFVTGGIGGVHRHGESRKFYRTLTLGVLELERDTILGT
ncbi:hypothetical protein RIF29_14008 [Crotalaria pallida]|uniref:Uncharacterized protein n=1 Tax=Crotalaria pallida TaxID=3830 RepID=A0AAN9I9W9_CROPI